MDPFEKPKSQEIKPKILYIERNEPALITIGMSEDFETKLKDMHFSKQMYFEDRIAYLQRELRQETGQLFELTATESTLEVRPVAATYQFEEKAINVINRLLDMANQE